MRLSTGSQSLLAEDRMHDAEAEEACRHENIVILTAWMAENGYTPSEIADAVEKPWNYRYELRDAKEAS